METSHFHVEQYAMGIECDGTHSGDKKGTWKGHVFPGALFIVWGTWWTLSVLARLLWTATPRRFRSQGWYPFSWLPFLRLAEPALKILLPPLAVSVELYIDHPDGFRYLRCPEGTLFAGRFALSHVNNWQHASLYPSIVISGFVDLLSSRVPLPSGTTHFFLALAFAVQAFIMGTHEKHQPQDAMVHWLLLVSMLICLGFVLLELLAPLNPLPALGRGASAIFQGAWLCQIARIEFEHWPQWSEDYSGGAMLAPVYFVSIALVVASWLFCVGLLMGVLRSRSLVPARLLIHEDDANGDLSSSERAWNDFFANYQGLVGEPAAAVEFIEDEVEGSKRPGVNSVNRIGVMTDSACNSRHNSPLHGRSSSSGRNFQPFRVMDGAMYQKTHAAEV